MGWLDSHQPPWVYQGACRGSENPDAWFPETLYGPGDRRSPDVQRAYEQQRDHALALCRGCPVRVDCLSHALATDTRYGIWGGLTPAQREQLAG